MLYIFSLYSSLGPAMASYITQSLAQVLLPPHLHLPNASLHSFFPIPSLQPLSSLPPVFFPLRSKRVHKGSFHNIFISGN